MAVSAIYDSAAGGITEFHAAYGPPMYDAIGSQFGSTLHSTLVCHFLSSFLCMFTFCRVSPWTMRG